MDYKRFVRIRNDKKGDISPLLGNPRVFNEAIRELAEPFMGQGINEVVGLESRGFIFAGAVAVLLNAGVVMVRKKGALYCETLQEEVVDYTGTKKCLEIAKDAIQLGERVLLVDDWIETGSQMMATCRMVEKLGGHVVGVACLINQVQPVAAKFLGPFSFNYLIDLHERKEE
jgi:adenine phosphoribosyltransferase